MISIYSLIWTFLISCPIILLIFLFRRKSQYLMKYGVTFLCILYTFCAVRMLVPIELPEHQKVICDPYVFSFLMKNYAQLGAERRRAVLFIIFAIWFIGIIIAFTYYYITVERRLIKFRKQCYKGDGRAEQILKEIDPDSKIQILYTNLVKTPFLEGVFRPTIYMTEVECTDKQIKYILMHEYTHWKRKDPWKQLASYFMVIVFWWNPLFRFLHKDMKRIIEMGCDKTMLRDYPERYALEYLKTLCYVMEESRENLGDIGFSSLSFVKMDSEGSLKQRIYYALDAKENNRMQKRMNFLVVCLCFLWMGCSYYFILQPRYNPDLELRDHREYVFTGENLYLEKKRDGTYILHIGRTVEKISEKDIESGLYDSYPVIEEK